MDSPLALWRAARAVSVPPPLPDPGRPPARPRQTRPQIVATRPAPATGDVPCVCRGDRIGVVDCGCQGKPIVYACAGEPGPRCVIHAPSKPYREIREDSGRRVSTGKLPVCALCASRCEPARPRTGVLVETQAEVRWRWLSTAQATEDLLTLARALPWPIRGVAGVPRAGMWAAGLLATWLNVPLGVLGPRGLEIATSANRRLKEAEYTAGPWVVVDDDCWSGKSLQAAAAAIGGDVLTAAIVSRLKGWQPDLVARRWGGNWLCEWRYFSCWAMAESALDFDGILCRDCRPDEDDDGPRYRRFLATAEPQWIPRGWRVPLIVTARREIYRPQTLAWLACHGIEVDQLVMGDWSSLGERSWEKVARLKVETFAASGLRFFCESCPHQAETISRETKHPVICPTTGTIFGASNQLLA